MTAHVAGHVGERVRLAGWLHHQRALSKLSFVLLRDATGIVQVVVDEPEAMAATAELNSESVLEIEGLVAAVEQAPGGFEIHEPVITVLSSALEPPVVELRRPQLKEALPFLLDHAVLTLRHPARRAAAQVSAAAVRGFRSALDGRGFTEIHTPKTVASATEGGASVFALDYFGRPGYLAQSPQLYKQMMVGVFERVYESGPVFRAEPHDTVRHLAEYTSLDAEMGFITDHRDVMEVLRAVVASMVESVAVHAAGAVDLLEQSLPDVPAEIPSVHFTEAQRLIAADTGEDLANEPDLAPAHERWLGEWARREHGSDFVFVTGYPAVKKPFYTHPEPGRPQFTNSFDLLFRGVELVSGGQRLDRHEDYIDALTRSGFNLEPFAAYLEAFRHGMPPHGGFGLGLERFVARIVGAANIRETTLFPRDRTRLSP